MDTILDRSIDQLKIEINIRFRANNRKNGTKIKVGNKKGEREGLWKIGEYFPWMENDVQRGEEGSEGSRLIEAILESTALQRFLW